MKTLVKLTTLTVFAIILTCLVGCGVDEPETKDYYTVYIDEICIGGVENTSSECVQWRSENANYQDGSGTAPNGHMKYWTRYFYDTESAVKAWCNNVNGFSIIKSETRQDKFNARYEQKHYSGKDYVPVAK